MIYHQKFSAKSILSLAFTLAIACHSDKKSDKDGAATLPSKPVNDEPVISQTSQLPTLIISTELTSAGLMVKINNIPDGSRLECDIDEQPIMPCHDGALISTPSIGDHKIKATAILNNQIIAIGESKPFTIKLEHIGQTNPDDIDPLRLNLTNSDFVSGMPLPVSKEFKFQFALPQPESCQAQLFCRYGSSNSDFWAKCDEQDRRQFIVDAGLMAMGRQSLSVQARCTDKVGPILELTWYGVGDNYQALSLGSVADPQGKTFAYLQKADDCSPSALTFECAEPGEGNDWALCPMNNVLDKPAPGSRVRASCDGRKGPPLKL